ncbi:MAG: D-aminoacyl-tRNA deacylase [Thermoprotei archaeon]|nr:D-aminoacyl-tRNA deacylase [TACK group archaeon]
MRAAVIASALDPAGAAMLSYVRSALGSLEEATLQGGCDIRFSLVQEDLIDISGSSLSPADLLIFPSRHVGKRPTLTVHVSGNPGKEAKFGGLPRSLSVAAPGPMASCIRSMVKRAPQGYEVTYEVTHHGPSDVNTPSFFAEVGGTEREWHDEVAIKAAAESILASLLDWCSGSLPFRPVLGLGGPHYAPLITRTALASGLAPSHILSGDVLEEDSGHFVEKMMRLAVLRSGAPVRDVLLDWKGVNGPTRREVLKAATLLGLGVIRA